MDVLAAGRVLTTTFEVDGDVSLRGYVDEIDEIAVIAGWALDLANLTAALPVDLCLAERIIAQTETGQPREDLTALLGARVNAGFRFGADALRLVATQAKTQPDVTLEVRIGSTSLRLASDRPLPTAGEVADLIAEAERINSAHERLGLHALLHQLANRADDLVELTLRSVPENRQGYIDLITVNSAGYVWFIGWMNKGHLLEFSAVAADGSNKIACGVALLCFDRDDVPSHACGVVGVIASEWRPNTLDQDFALFFAAAVQYYISASQPLRVVPAADFIAKFDDVYANAPTTRRGKEMARLLHESEHWSVTNAAIQGYVVHALVDRLLLIPGFGYLAEGWVLSPAKRVRHLQLRVGGKVLRCWTETLYHKPRQDLLPTFPGQDMLIRNAGFVACFVGEVTSEDVSEPTLTIAFEDDTVWNQPVALEVVRQFGHSANLEDLRLFYSAIEDEPFFPRLAERLLKKTAAAALRAATVAPAAAVIIFVLPPDRCDLVLLFAEIARNLASPNFLRTVGVALIATSSSSRGDTVHLFRDLARNTPNAASLFFVDDASQPFDSISPILQAVGAERFVFVGPSVLLSCRGWAEAARAVVDPVEKLTFLHLKAEAWQSVAATDIPAALCFAWWTTSFVAWHERAPRVWGGFFRDNGLTFGQSEIVRYDGAGRITRPREATLLETAVNAIASEMPSRDAS